MENNNNLNMDLVKSVLGWKNKLTGDEKSFLPIAKEAFFGFRKGNFVVQNPKLGYNKVSRIETPKGSIGDIVGCNPAVFRISFPSQTQLLTVAECCALFNVVPDALFDTCINQFGNRILNDEGSKVLTFLDDTLTSKAYRLRDPKNWMGTKFMTNICRRLLDKANISIGDLISPHPRWITMGSKNEIYLVYAPVYANSLTTTNKVNWNRFMDSIGAAKDHESRMKIFIRAGKDMWSKPLCDKRVLKLKVVEPRITEKSKTAPKGKASHDGNFFIKPNCGQPSDECLVRAFPVTNEVQPTTGLFHNIVGKVTNMWFETVRSFFILKGRAITLDASLIDEMTDDPNLDGITTLDNLKWLPKNHNIKHGDTIKVATIYSKDEDNEKKDAYNFNLLSLCVGRWEPNSRATIINMFQKQMAKVGRLIGNPDANLINTIDEFVEDGDKDALTLSDLIAKYHLGLTHKHKEYNKDENIRLYKKLIRKTRSIKFNDTDYVSVIFSDEWFGKSIKRGQYLASKTFGENLHAHGKYNEDITFARYPIVSYQSFMKLKHVGEALGLPGRTIIMHPDDAVYCQGDGDDHVLALFGLDSLFSPASCEKPYIAREDVVDRGYNYDQLELYFKGAVAQSGIGTTFNLMLTAIVGVMDQVKANTLTKAQADMYYDTIYTEFGGALDMFAQGIKKNLELPELEHLRSLAINIIGYNPESLTNKEMMLKTGNAMKVAQIYLGTKTPKMLTSMMEVAWKVKIPNYVPIRPVKRNRNTTNVPDALKSKLNLHIYKGFIPVASRDSEFIGHEAGSPVTWHIELSEIIEKHIGCTYAQIKANFTDGDIDEKLAIYIDSYAYVAYALKMIIDNPIETFGDDAEGIIFIEDALVPRLEKMNGLTILASQLV
jgi:hypothetical protein